MKSERHCFLLLIRPFHMMLASERSESLRFARRQFVIAAPHGWWNHPASPGVTTSVAGIALDKLTHFTKIHTLHFQTNYHMY